MNREHVIAHLTRPRWIGAALAVILVVAGLGLALALGVGPFGDETAAPDPAAAAGDDGEAALGQVAGEEPGQTTAADAAAGAGTGDLRAGALPDGRPLSNLGDVYRDADRDGLPNLLENYIYGSNPNRSSTSGGDVPDGWLARYDYDPTVPGIDTRWAAYPGPDETPDAYGPGGLPAEYRMTLREAYAWERPDDWNQSVDGPWDNGLDPSRWDQGAGIPFSWLIRHELDPFDPTVGERVLDPAPEGGDGLTVNESYRTATDPRATDTDGDGLADDVEVDDTGTDPSAFATAGFGVADGWALDHDLDATDPQMPLADPDKDGLQTKDEFAWSVENVGLNATLDGRGLDPRAAESAGAGLPDGWLVDQGLDPLEAGVADKVIQRVSDYGPAAERGVDEYVLTVRDAYAWDKPDQWNEAVDGPWMGGLSADTNDTDGDGLPDAVEIAGWTVNVTLGTGPSRESSDRHTDADPTRADTDRDGLSDAAEFLGRVRVSTDGTDATASDADAGAGAGSNGPGSNGSQTDIDGNGDGSGDGSGERVVETRPTDARARDTDFDGLGDRVETVEIPRKAAQAGVEGDALEPTVQDTDSDGLADGDEFSYWTRRSARYRSGATEYEFENRDTDGVSVLGAMPGARPDRGAATRGTVASALEPWGDLDGDGAINVLDADSDADELNDGWEVDPTTYAQSPFSSEHPRPATDPANTDTDGDELPDGWETRFGDWDFDFGNWNLDPSTWDTFGDGTPDGERDLDDDGTTWYRFTFTGSDYEREEQRFEATNLVEHEHGTDPNEVSTPGNGLRDGWAIFWGKVYPDKPLDEVGDVYPGAPGPIVLPPGAPRPSPGQDLDAVTDQADRVRFSTESQARPGEILETSYGNVEDAETGEVRDVFRFRETVRFSFTHEQKHGTNPYLQDTDADTVPDAWEVAYATGGTPNPLAFERDADADGDDLTLAEEYRARTDPSARDTDLGGVQDGEEANPKAPTDPLNPADDVRLRDASVDTDGDGIPDIEEVQGWQHPTLGEIQTDPKTADTDGDGLADGDHVELDPDEDGAQERIDRLEAAGIVPEVIDGEGTIRFPGEVAHEADPRAASTVGDGVPDGWRAFWGLDVDEQERDVSDVYAFARPDWWDEATMGTWWWGASPLDGSNVDGDGRSDHDRIGDRVVFRDVDLDQDGLSDVNGEDPTPAARAGTTPPEGFPNEPGLSESEVRERARAFGVDPRERDAAADRDTDDDGVPDADDRVQVRLEDVALDAPERDGDTRLRTGQAYNASGRVLADDADGTAVPVPNATVAVHLWSPEHPLGYAATGPDGMFEATFRLQTEHSRPAPPPGIAFLGQTRGPVSWSTSLDELEMGPGSQGRPNELVLQVYNTSGAARPGDPTHLDVPAQLPAADGSTTRTTAQGIRGLVSDPIDFTLESTSRVDLKVPETLAVGEALDATVTLVDGTGDPLEDATVRLEVAERTREVTTDGSGQATATFEDVADEPGELTLSAAYDGEGFVLATQEQATVPVVHPTRLEVTRIQPLPAAAGGTLTVAGHLASPADATGRAIEVGAGDASANATTREPNATGDGAPFTADLDLPDDLPAGNLTVTVRFPGDDGLDAARVENDVPLKALPEIGIATVSKSSQLRPDSPAQLVVGVTDHQGNTIPGPVTVRGLPGETGPKIAYVGTDEPGSVAWTTSSEPGAHRVVVEREGGDRYLEARNQTWLVLQVPTQLTAQPTPLFRGRTAEVTGTLSGADGATIPGGRIALDLAGETVAENTTDIDGRFTLDWTVSPGRALGPTDATLRYEPAPGSPWSASSHDTVLPVRAAVLASALEPFALRADPRVPMSLQMASGAPVSTGTALLELPDLGVSAREPVQGGEVTFAPPVPRDVEPGTYEGRVDLLGAPDLTAPPAPVPVTLATPVDLTVQAPGRVGQGDALDLHVQARDDLGQPVTRGTVHARLADGAPVNASLDDAEASGARLSVPVPDEQSTGPTTVAITYHGPAGFLDASVERTVEVLRGTEIRLDLPGRAEPGERVEGTVQLATVDGEALAGERVFVRHLASNASTFLVTNETGHAPLTLEAGRLGPTSVEVRYAGDPSQASASVNHALVPLAPEPGTGPGALVVALAGALALAVVGVGVWGANRRRTQREVAQALDRGTRLLEEGNEYRATVVLTYFRLVDILETQGVVPEETDTLREYQHEIEDALGLRTPALADLFDVFDEVLYSPDPPAAEHRRRAIDASVRVSRELWRQVDPGSGDEHPEGVGSLA